MATTRKKSARRYATAPADWQEVKTCIEGGENNRVEFKRELGNLNQVGRAICALANSEGGLVVIGVEDDGTVRGVPGDPQAARERLVNLLQTGCSSPISADIGMRPAESGTVHWIAVQHQGRFEPYRHRGRFVIRRDRSSVEPSASELQELFYKFGYVLTEDQVVSAARVEDINLPAFRTHQRRIGIDMEDEPLIAIEDDLLAAGIVSEVPRGPAPTLYGLMVFGLAPQDHPHTSSFFVQCTRYLGVDRSADIASYSDAKGRLEDQVNQSMVWFRSLGRAAEFRGWHRIDRPLVPDKVIREAVVNAVVHRDYAIVGSKVTFEVFDTHIDVTSPGTLPNHMTVQNVRSGGRPLSRNEAMANALLVARLMEQRGRGWLIMRRAMREFNRTEPELIHDRINRYVRVRFDLRAPPN